MGDNMEKVALRTGVSALILSMMALPTTAHAQDAAQDQDAAAVAEEIVITGSRRAARSPADTPSPVDVITAEQFANQGDSDVANLIRNLVPSYNVRPQPISDAATFIRPANLRGLPPDSTLILVNGKRRHRAAVITFLGQGLADGAQGPDISVIPAIALERVDVLRDGAAAQYGADAIAGVLNFVLRDDPDGGSVEVKYGSTYEGDGDQYQIAGNIGLPVTDDGYLNLSFEFREADETIRSVQRDDAQGLIDAGNTAVRQPFAQTWGSPEVDNDYKIFFNFGVQASDNMEVYAFGNYAQRRVDGGFFFRNPDTRGGVFSNDGGVTRLVGDLTPDDGMDCPVVPVGDADALQLVIDDPNCFVFNELFPGGFTPRFGGSLNDIAGTGGVRGELDFGLIYDISASAGRNEIDFVIRNTVNAALGPNTPTTFEPGSYIQLEKQVNIDLSYPIEVDYFASPLNVAAGFEWREEQFEIQPGDSASFASEPLASQGFTPGSNGFSGFSPDIAGEFDRKNIAFYIDLEADITEDLVLGVAGRLEDFSDFGTTTNGKFSALWKATDNFSVRGTYSTGFRAPTPGQSNVTNISTVFENGRLINRGTVPPTLPLALEFGGEPLGPEKSRSFTVGGALDVGDLNVTVDFFRIKVEDRIAQTSSIELTPEEAAALEAQGITGASAFAAFRFFANDFDTTTRGVDIVATYPLDLFGGDTDINFAGNWTKTKVGSSERGLIDPTRERQIEEGLPRYRGNLGLTHIQDWFRGLIRLNYYGKFYEAHLDDGTLGFVAGSEITADVEVGVTVFEGLELAAGAENIFDNTPDLNPFRGVVGSKFPETSPYGFNGGYYYFRARYNF